MRKYPFSFLQSSLLAILVFMTIYGYSALAQTKDDTQAKVFLPFIAANSGQPVQAVSTPIAPLQQPTPPLATPVSSAGWLQVLGHLGREQYVAMCSERMGTVPAFNCLEGVEIPIKVNGTPQATLPSACDKPIQLGIPHNAGQNGQCAPYARTGQLTTGNPDVTTVFICRKYANPFTGNDDYFQDIAVIQHNRQTGDTCWFQSPVRDAVNNVNLNGRSVPSPMDTSAIADNYWRLASEVATCQNCHDADPFIWTPYIGQVVGSNPAGWNPNGPYTANFLNIFGATQPYVFAKLKRSATVNNACTQCHRIGANSDLVAKSIAGGWMPPAATPNSTVTPNPTDVAQINNCRATPTLAGCNAATALPVAPKGSIYVDKTHQGVEKGSARFPFRTITGANTFAESGAWIVLRSNSYNEQLTFHKQLRLLVEGGSVTIGR